MVITDEPVQVIQDAQGEHDRRLDVISPVSLRFESEISLFKPGQKRQIIVELNAARAGLAGALCIWKLRQIGKWNRRAENSN